MCFRDIKQIFIFILLFTIGYNTVKGQTSEQRYYDSLTAALPKLKNAEKKVLALDTIGKYCLEPKPDTALMFATQGLQLAQSIGYIYGEAHTRILLAQLYSQTGNYPRAIEQARKALQLFTKINAETGIASAWNQLAIQEGKQGNYDTATLYLLKAEKIYEKENDSESIAVVYVSLGRTVQEDVNPDKAFDKALDYFNRAMVYSKDKKVKLNILNNIGIVYGKKQELDKALTFFKKVLKESDSSTFAIVRMQALTNCVVVYNNRSDDLNAIKCIDEQLFLARKCHLLEGEILGLINKGVAIRHRNLAAGVKLIHEGLALAEKSGNKRLQIMSYDNLVGVYVDCKKYKDAYLMLEEKNKLSSQLFTIEKAKNIAQIKEQYETEKKDDQIKLLNQDRSLQELKLKNEKTTRNYVFTGILFLSLFSTATVYNRNRRRKLIFQKQISETEMTALRAQMNPHFLFNSLNSIHSYIQDNNNTVASAYLLDFSKLTRIILENSVHQSISLNEEIQALELYFSLEARRMDKKLDYEINISPEIDTENTLIPPLILQPFIENAILHGLQHKEDGGKIKLTITLQNNMLHCTIEDNGIGREKASQLRGKFASKKESLGMKLTNQRIDIINKQKKSAAYLTVTDITDNGQTGVRVILTLPLETRF